VSSGNCKNNICSKKKPCCEGYECKKKGKKFKCVKQKIVAKFHWTRTLLGRNDEGDDTKFGYGDMTISAKGEVLVVPQKEPDLIYVITDPFEDPNKVPRASTRLKAHPVTAGRTYWANAVSGDGKTVAVSDYKHAEYTGIVKIFKLEDMPGGFWYETAELLGVNFTEFYNETWGSSFGTSMALNYDGSVLVVGADNDDFANETGVIERYIYNETYGWDLDGSPIFGRTGDQIGRLPLEITDDGNRIAVGSDAGYAAVYDFNETYGDWELVQNFTYKVAPDDDPEYGEETIRLSSDGSMLAIGEADFGSDEQGAIHMFKWNEATYMYEEYLSPIKGSFSDAEVGWSFGMSNNGKRVAYADYSEPTKVHVMSVSKNKWKAVQTIEQDGYEAYEVLLSRDGNKLALTYPYFEDENGYHIGKVDLYEWRK